VKEESIWKHNLSFHPPGSLE